MAASKADVTKWSDLKGRPVVDIGTAKRVGSVDDLVLDPQTREVVGLKFKPGLFNADQTVPISLVASIGQDAVTLRLEGVSQDAPEEKTLSKLPALSDVLNNSVVTEGGKLVGSVSNVQLRTDPLAITGYEVSEGGLFAKKHSFEVTPNVHYGEKLLTVPDSLVDTFTPSA